MTKIPKNAGKSPAVMFYYKDFLIDMQGHPPEIIGAWILILIHIWHTRKNGQLVRNIDEIAKIVQCDEAGTRNILNYLDEKNIADVTECNGEITITNRRMQRECKLLEQNRIRQQKMRDSMRNNENVTDVEPPPSFSFSISTSVNDNINNTPVQKKTVPAAVGFTLKEVLDKASMIGIPEEEARQFYDYYNRQGWVTNANLPIRNLDSAMATWRNNEFKFETKTKNGKAETKTKLFPIQGKSCGVQGCQLPAVYCKDGDYKHYYCGEHMPKLVKEKYTW